MQHGAAKAIEGGDEPALANVNFSAVSTTGPITGMGNTAGMGMAGQQGLQMQTGVPPTAPASF